MEFLFETPPESLTFDGPILNVHIIDPSWWYLISCTSTTTDSLKISWLKTQQCADKSLFSTVTVFQIFRSISWGVTFEALTSMLPSGTQDSKSKHLHSCLSMVCYLGWDCRTPHCKLSTIKLILYWHIGKLFCYTVTCEWVSSSGTIR